MPSKVYDLLTVEAANGPWREATARGYLADQNVDLFEKYPIPMRIAGAIARLRRQPELQLLGVEFTTDPVTQQVTARSMGLLAPLFRSKAERLCKSINDAGRPIATYEDAFVYTLYQPPVPSSRMLNHLSRVLVQGRGPLRPTTCTLQVTSHCQLDCYHCSAARFTCGDREELTTEEWIDVVRQAEGLGVNNIVFTGGEPLLRKDIFDLIAAVNPERANSAMFSNGLMLTHERVARLAEAGIFSIMVSLDDVRPEVHDELRRVPGGFEKAVEGIRRALESGLLVGISTYAGPEDVREGRVEQMIEFVRDVGVHEITIFDTVPTGKLLPLDRAWLLTDDDKKRLIEIGSKYNELEGYPHVITQSFINGPDGAGCFAGYIQFYMTAYGDVNPCDFTPLTFGNIRDEPLERIWDRVLAHPAYRERSDHCRMQDSEFRQRYIDDIPDDVLLPWPANDELLDRPNCPQKCGSRRAVCAG